jgi:hypothetical protein
VTFFPFSGLDPGCQTGCGVTTFVEVKMLVYKFSIQRTVDCLSVSIRHEFHNVCVSWCTTRAGTALFAVTPCPYGGLFVGLQWRLDDVDSAREAPSVWLPTYILAYVRLSTVRVRWQSRNMRTSDITGSPPSVVSRYSLKTMCLIFNNRSVYLVLTL